jgi:predicted transcriptional regulator
MQEKGYITRRKESRAFLYRAKVREEEAHRGMVSDLLEHVFEGSESSLVSSLLDRRDLRPEELEKIERLIAERKRRGKP